MTELAPPHRDIDVIYCRKCATEVLAAQTRTESVHRSAEGLVSYVRCPAGHLVVHQFAEAYPKPKPAASVLALQTPQAASEKDTVEQTRPSDQDRDIGSTASTAPKLPVMARNGSDGLWAGSGSQQRETVGGLLMGLVARLRRSVVASLVRNGPSTGLDRGPAGRA